MKSKKKIAIYGAGLAGLLAAFNLCDDYEVVVLDAKEKLEPNHFALLRFNKDISTYLPLPLEKVKVDKAIWHNHKLTKECNLKLNNLYSKKVTGEYRRRSINNLETEDRWVYNSKLWDDLYYGCAYKGVTFISGKEFKVGDARTDHTILTIPLPVMLKEMEVENYPIFKSSPITTYTADLGEKVNLHQTIYYPNSALCQPMYRASIVGRKLIAELVMDKHSSEADNLAMIHNNIAESFGISMDGVKDSKFNYQKLGKIIAIDEGHRRNLIYNMTKDYGFFTLGRFATWREKVMLPDVCKDIDKIKSWIEMSGLSGYEKMKRSI